METVAHPLLVLLLVLMLAVAVVALGLLPKPEISLSSISFSTSAETSDGGEETFDETDELSDPAVDPELTGESILEQGMQLRREFVDLKGEFYDIGYDFTEGVLTPEGKKTTAADVAAALEELLDIKDSMDELVEQAVEQASTEDLKEMGWMREDIKEDLVGVSSTLEGFELKLAKAIHRAMKKNYPKHASKAEKMLGLKR